jgi:hypothetical protein
VNLFIDIRNTPRSCFKFVCFTPSSLNAPYKYMPLLNLSFHFRSTLFGWCISSYAHIFTYGNIIFDLRLFYLRPCFLGNNEGVKQALVHMLFSSSLYAILIPIQLKSFIGKIIKFMSNVYTAWNKIIYLFLLYPWRHQQFRLCTV